MWPLFIYPDHYKKSFTFYFIYYKKGKMLGLPTKKQEKQNIILMTWFLEKSLVYLMEHCYLYQAMLILSAAPLNTTLLNH